MFSRRILAVSIGFSLLLNITIDARGDINSFPTVVFSKSSDNKPYFSQWTSGAWSPSSGTAMSSIGSVPNWVVLANCPTRTETACATINSSKQVHLMIHNGTSWSAPTQVGANVGAGYQRSVAIAYEQSSGDLLIAYWDTSANKIAYRTWDGSTLSAESTLVVPQNSAMKYMALYPRPFSDEIIILTVQNNPTLNAAVWNGSAWGTVTELSSGLAWKDQQAFDLAYESLSGRALLVYSKNSTWEPQYRFWDGSSWSAAASAPNFNASCNWVRLAADSDSNSILFGGNYSWSGTRTLNVNVWNGSSWGTPVEIENSFPDADIRRFDIAYEKDTGKGLVVYQEGTQTSLRYRTWNGSSWSTEQTGSNLGDAPRFIQLRTGTATGEIFIAASDAGDDLEMLRWNGSSMSATQQLCGSLGGSSTTEQFMMAMPAERLMAPANIPYSTAFEAGVGSEWNSWTLTNNTTYSKFLGTHRSGALKLALNTTIGESYTVKFDLYSIDSWNGSEAGGGPDYFDVSADGTLVFHHTFTNRPTTQAYTYPYPADMKGNYGFDSSFEDGAFRAISLGFTATSTVTKIAFEAPNAIETDIDAWGIDNVSVQVAKFLDVSSAKTFNVATTTGGWGSGIHWADLDNDGDLDAILTGSSSSRLMKYNSSSGVYAASSFGGGSVYRQGALMDFDNDGDIDFWGMTHYDNEKLFLNDGSGSFADSGNMGNPNPSGNEAIAGADVNGDGWCDVVNFSENGNWIGHKQGEDPTLVGTNDASYGLNGSGNYGDGDYCSSGDVNNDNRIDFFNHYNGGRLFLSNGDGTYTRDNYNISATTGASDKFGSAWGDYDNDGDLDLFCARFGEGYSGTLWRNDRNWAAGTGNFTDVTISAGLTINSAIDFTNYKPGTRSCCWGDYDNDGDLDLFILGANGNNYLYQNQGNGSFLRVAEGTGDYAAGQDACFVDYDNDGDLDLAITREDATAVLLQNRTNNTNYLKVRVIGRGAGATDMAAVGTRVELWNSAGTTRLARRDIGVARGYGGTEPLWAHFGGVTPTSNYKVKVYVASRSADNPYVVSVKPNSASTTIGASTIPRMLTVRETNRVKVVQWSEWLNKAP